jgi:PP-loop superfamily ATP-utilizing enzyme
MDNAECGCKFVILKHQIAMREFMLIAYSGGGDSSLPAAFVQEVLGEKAYAVFIDSPLVPRSVVIEAYHP